MNGNAVRLQIEGWIMRKAYIYISWGRGGRLSVLNLELRYLFSLRSLLLQQLSLRLRMLLQPLLHPLLQLL